MTKRIYSFPPVIDAGCHTLILGTMPSVKSLEGAFYYAHPRNAFWPVMARVLGEDAPDTIEDKKAMLLRHGVALWDTAASCEREGSLDAAMKDVILNDVGALLDMYPRIGRIFLNGGEAYRLFSKMNIERAGLYIERLPSTSPAYTLPFEEKLEAWRRAFAGRTEMMI